MNHSEVKKSLLEHCYNYVEERKTKVLSQITSIENSLFEEGKSTAGDKHHTGRAMLQIDRENAGKQLLEIEKVETLLKRVIIDTKTKNVSLGSLVNTSKGVFFMSISLGGVVLDGKTYFCVAPTAPIGKLLLGKTLEESVTFNGSLFKIEEIN